MRDEEKTKAQLIEELAEMRQQYEMLKISMKKNSNDKRLGFLANVIEKSSNPFIAVYPDFRLMTCNPAFSMLTGYSEEELFCLTGNKDFVESEFWMVDEQVLEDMKQSGGSQRYEKVFSHKKGVQITVEVHIHAMADDSGNVEYYYAFVSDVTERNQVQMALEEHSKFMQLLIDTIPSPLFYKDTSGLYQGCNQAYEKYFGLSKQEMNGKSVHDLFPPDLADIYYEMDSVLFNDPGIQTYEFPILDASGRKREVIINKATYNSYGIVAGMVGVITDITERNKAQKALRLSEEKFSKAFTCSPDPMAITRLHDSCYVEVNEAFFLTTGFEPAEVLGKSTPELNLWVDPEQRKVVLDKIYNKQEIRTLETEFRTKSGQIRTALLSMDIIEMAGEPHIISIVRDITERKEVEKALLVSEERFSKAFNLAPVAMCISTIEEGLYINMNDSFCNLFDCRREETIGRTSLDTVGWVNRNDRSRVKQMIEDTGSVREMEFYFFKQSGKHLLGLYFAEKLELNGEGCILSIIVDITERRQLEYEMLRLDRLNVVGEVAAGIGHEIRNPMTAVRGFLQLFRDKYEEDQEYLNLMIEELDRANAIITEFLSLAKTKAMEVEEANLNTIIQTILPLLRANAVVYDQYVETEFQDVPNLLLDKKEIRQMIFNLVRNGLESMSSGGRVIIKTYREGEGVVLSIQDEGHGIKKEILDKLGTPFFTTKDNGTGLGLAVCYGIANRHHAVLAVRSSSCGTTFAITFPAVDQFTATQTEKTPAWKPEPFGSSLVDPENLLSNNHISIKS